MSVFAAESHNCSINPGIDDRNLLMLIYELSGYNVPENEKHLNTYSQEDLQRGVSHLNELEIHQTARYRYISVVLRCPRRRRADRRHPAPWAILHPPGAMHGQVEGQDQVSVLRDDRQPTSASDHKQI